MGTGILLFKLLILITILWYIIKFIVRSKGYPMHLFYRHLRDIHYMKQIIESEQSQIKKQGYTALLYSLYICIGGLVALLLWSLVV